LFVPNWTILNYEGDPNTHQPHSTIKGRAAIRSALAILNTFTDTLHMNGQSEVMIQGDHAIGETYCLVHQFTEEKDQRKCQALGIRYLNQFRRQESRWYFVERKLVIDWSDTRISIPSVESAYSSTHLAKASHGRKVANWETCRFFDRA
jgi:hypothetical protein